VQERKQKLLSRNLESVFCLSISKSQGEARNKGAPKEHHPQIPDSEFPSFRGSLFGPRQRDSQIPPNSRFRVSEFPRTPLGTWVAARGTRKFPDSEFPSVIPRAYVRREQIPEYTAQFLFPLLYSCVATCVAFLPSFSLFYYRSSCTGKKPSPEVFGGRCWLVKAPPIYDMSTSVVTNISQLLESLISRNDQACDAPDFVFQDLSRLTI